MNLYHKGWTPTDKSIAACIEGVDALLEHLLSSFTLDDIMEGVQCNDYYYVRTWNLLQLLKYDEPESVDELISLLDDLLDPMRVQDYCLNNKMNDLLVIINLNLMVKTIVDYAKKHTC